MKTVRETFIDDHDRLLSELQGMLRIISKLDADDLRGYLGRFGRALQRHLTVEEQALVPRLCHTVADPERIERLIHREHDALRALVTHILADLAREEMLAAMGGLGELEAALRLHVISEEQMLYPMLDKAA